ncbi:MAG: zinc ABC transporter substrate-binding protein [Yoonia sp.]|nr:zinc ABC transporter substrate-binding protein [Yoonia sp.]
MRLTSIFAGMIFATQSTAAPNVLTDLAPIHGLVSAVMGDIGAPTLLLPPSADAHSYALRPSDARTLSNAELIIWVGHDLTPWLADPIATLATSAVTLELLESAGWDQRDLGGHDDHGDIDPHAWIDPAVAAVWVGHIADQLADIDPANAETYQANAQNYATDLMQLRTALKARLAPATGQPIIWPHDAYGYFEDAFDLMSVATIADAAANSPGPAHIARLRSLPDVACVLADPEISDRWTAVIAEGTSANSGMIDLLGADIPLGTDHYINTLQAMADTVTACVTGK